MLARRGPASGGRSPIASCALLRRADSYFSVLASVYAVLNRRPSLVETARNRGRPLPRGAPARMMWTMSGMSGGGWRLGLRQGERGPQ